MQDQMTKDRKPDTHFDAVDAGADALHRGVDAAKEGVNAAGNMACRTKDQVKDRVKEGAHVVNDAVHDHPYGALAIGAGIGILVGMFLRRGH